MAIVSGGLHLTFSLTHAYKPVKTLIHNHWRLMSVTCKHGSGGQRFLNLVQNESSIFFLKCCKRKKIWSDFLLVNANVWSIWTHCEICMWKCFILKIPDHMDSNFNDWILLLEIHRTTVNIPQFKIQTS